MIERKVQCWCDRFWRQESLDELGAQFLKRTDTYSEYVTDARFVEDSTEDRDELVELTIVQVPVVAPRGDR